MVFDRNKYYREYYQKNKEKVKGLVKRYQQSEKGKEKIKEYREANKDKLSDWRREYLSNKYKNSAEFRQQRKEIIYRWRKKHPDKYKRLSIASYYNLKEKIKTDPEKAEEYSKYCKEKTYRWRQKYPEKYSAQRIAQKSIDIPEGQICERCNKELATERHHPDYSVPSWVELLCKKCHNIITNQEKE
jgi:hypothetical protein